MFSETIQNSYLDNPFIQILLTILITALLHLVFRDAIGRIVARTIHSHKYASKIEERKRVETLARVFRAVLGFLLWTIAVLVILMQLHVQLAPLLTGAGLVGVIIGFGAQNTLKDYLAGMFIILENQYRVGDIVTLKAGGGEVSGVVEDITLRVTRLRDLDGNLHTVPNGASSVVTNRSFKFANVNIDVHVSYDSDLETAREVINRVGLEQAEDEHWKRSVLEPIQFLRVDSFNDFSVTLKSIGKVQPAMQWDLAGDFRLRIKKAFEEAGVKIPLPQLVVRRFTEK